jgi:hypothetical protein
MLKPLKIEINCYSTKIKSLDIQGFTGLELVGGFEPPAY